MRKSILKHCLVNPGSTEFALLDESGNFFRLDETGNFEVLSQTTTAARKITATVSGVVDREILKVTSLSTGNSVPATEVLAAGGSSVERISQESGGEMAPHGSSELQVDRQLHPSAYGTSATTPSRF
jgi:hypothetical protein